MKWSQTKLGTLVACLAAVFFVAAMTGTLSALEVGVGLSDSKEARAAGTEAATQAKAALGEAIHIVNR